MTQTVYTKVVETDVLGVKAYHVDCSCGFKSKRYDHEVTAQKHALMHAKHAHA